VRDYKLRSPGASDVGLLVEIADTSLVEDRKMAQTYGARGIPVYWIVNLVDRQVEVYAFPTPAGYSGPQAYLPGNTVPVVLDGVVVGKITVDDILP
jgi:Uma2 family endonuclease